MRLCCAAEMASVLYHGGTLWVLAQRHDECPRGASIKRLLYAGRMGHSSMGNIKAHRPLLPRASPGG